MFSPMKHVRDERLSTPLRTIILSLSSDVTHIARDREEEAASRASAIKLHIGGMVKVIIRRGDIDYTKSERTLSQFRVGPLLY